MQNVSFGNKIPLSKAQIYDKKAQEFKKTVLYELDGRDASDIDELAMRTGAWEYKYCMTADLASKNQKLDSNRGGVNLSQLQQHLLERNKFYVLETEDGKLAAICETNGYLNHADVHFLESDTKNYGLAGQTILASIVKQMLKQPEASFEVSDPVAKARGFYMESCGFKEKEPGSHGLIMEEKDMENFVSNVEDRLQTQIEGGNE